MPGVNGPSRLAFPSDWQSILDRLTALEHRQSAAAASGAATGDIKYSALPSAPAGWLVADHSAVTVASGNTALRNALIAAGNPFGTSGSDPLLPDGRDNVIMGASATHALGATGGEATHVLTIAELAAHVHTVTDPGHTHGIANASLFGTAGTQEFHLGGGFSQGTTSSTTGIAVNSVGSDAAHNNLQPFVALTMLIKT